MERATAKEQTTSVVQCSSCRIVVAVVVAVSSKMPSSYSTAERNHRLACRTAAPMPVAAAVAAAAAVADTTTQKPSFRRTAASNTLTQVRIEVASQVTSWAKDSR